MVCVDPASLAGEELEARLGMTIERVRKLGANAVAIDPFVRDARGELVAAWFPTAHLPLRADVLSRIAWQLQTRAGVRVFVRIPRSFGVAVPQDFERLAQDLADAVQLDGVLFEAAPAFEKSTRRRLPNRPGKYGSGARVSMRPGFRLRRRR